MKHITILTIAALLFGSGQCFARLPECDPGLHGCDNKILEQSLIKLSPFKIAGKNGNIHFEMNKTGQIRQEGKVVGSINRAGKIVDPHGKLIANLRETSILEDSKGMPLVKVDTDGTLDDGSGVLIRWLQDGTFSQGENILDAKLLPSNSPARRAASIVFFLGMSFGKSTTTEAPTTTTKATAHMSSSKPTGACYISSGAGNDCFSGMTQQGCYNAASKVGGTADWREGQSCSK
jgi:hypothetical protein